MRGIVLVTYLCLISYSVLVFFFFSSRRRHTRFANDLRFLANDRLVASFPFYDPACERSANAKARHLMPYRANRIIFTGDGHSDLDAALAADVVFAKCALANELDARGVAFYPFDTLEPVLAFLETVEDALREPAAWAARQDEGG